MRVNLNAPEVKKLSGTIAGDQLLSTLLGMSYTQIDNWIDVNVNTVADVRAVFKRLIKLFLFLIRHGNVNLNL
jgi:hypothetical protein